MLFDRMTKYDKLIIVISGVIFLKQSRKVLNLIVSQYAVDEYDWMRFKITEENPLTYHHIKKKAEGGEVSVSNGAPLTQEAQCYLHYIERKDIRTYNEINRVLKEINTQGFGPTEKQRKKIEYLMVRFEATHLIQLQNHRNQKKRLINPISARKRRQEGQKTKKIGKMQKK